MIIVHTYSGKSIRELQREFGFGPTGFQKHSWYDPEDFVRERPQAGEYEVCFYIDSMNQRYSEQTKRVRKSFYVPHAAIVIEAVLTHFKKTGERLLEDWYVRTSSFDSRGRHIGIGDFNDSGLAVLRWTDDDFYGNIGVSVVRKIDSKTVEKIPLETAIGICIMNGYTVTKN